MKQLRPAFCVALMHQSDFSGSCQRDLPPRPDDDERAAIADAATGNAVGSWEATRLR
jgi:hypothetical protein